MFALLQTSLSPTDALADFEQRINGAGGVVSFVGYVRPEAHGSDVIGLSLQAYSPLTENGIAAAITEAETRWPLKAVSVLHRIGDMAAGDPIVFVATASEHRRAAFEAADFLMDYLKTDAVFWKKELTQAGAVWIEPRAQDYDDRSRWDADQPNSRKAPAHVRNQ